MKRILVILGFLSFYGLFALDLPIKLVKPDTLYIGQSFTLEVDIPKENKTTFSEPKQINSEQMSLLKSEYKEGEKSYRYLLTVAAFDTGKVNVPPISFYRNHDHKIDSLQTQSFSVWISSSLTPADSTVKDIKKPGSVYLEWQDYVLLLIILNVISILYVMIKNIKNRRNKEQGFETIDIRPAWQKAYDMLLELRSKDLLNKNEWIEYHYSLSLVLRKFLMMQFNIKAVEMTTYEVKEALNPGFQHKKELIQLLNFCDQIKFAKGIPDLMISGQYETWLEQYILSFKPQSIETEQV